MLDVINLIYDIHIPVINTYINLDINPSTLYEIAIWGWQSPQLPRP